MAHYRRLKLPPLPADPEVPQYGKVAISQSEYAFEMNVMQLCTQHFSARREISHLLLWMYKMWEESFTSKSFVDIELTNLSLPCNIAEFDRIQSDKFKDTQDAVSVEWRRGISEHLGDNMQDIYDFFISGIEAF
jgi:hypothetical protein